MAGVLRADSRGTGTNGGLLYILRCHCVFYLTLHLGSPPLNLSTFQFLTLHSGCKDSLPDPTFSLVLCLRVCGLLLTSALTLCTLSH
jgi:hypothetical protein